MNDECTNFEAKRRRTHRDRGEQVVPARWNTGTGCVDPAPSYAVGIGDTS